MSMPTKELISSEGGLWPEDIMGWGSSLRREQEHMYGYTQGRFPAFMYDRWTSY